MTNFKELIINTLGNEVQKNNFKLFDEGPEKCVIFFKRFNKDVGLYIRCLDNRIHDRDVTVDFWIAPIQVPDDRLLSLNIGIKISVLSAFMVNDKIMTQVGKKINELSKNIDELAKVVRDECDKPYVKNRRTKIFQLMKKLYMQIDMHNEFKDELHNIKSKMKLALEKSKDVKKVYDDCTKFITKIPDDFFEEDFLDYGKEGLGDLLAEEIYSQCLFDL